MAENEKAYIELARKTIEDLVLNGEKGISNRLIKDPLPEVFQRKAGTFVSIKKNGQLRGCIGTIESTKKNLAEEIISNAVSAATRDPRFPSIQEDELPLLGISVDILGKPELVDSLEELDPHQYGIIVEKGFHRGVLLPDIDGIDTVNEQLAIALRKAGLRADWTLNGIKIYRFTVSRFK